MFRWLFDWQWSRRTSQPAGGALEKKSTFKLEKGKSYRATITLTGFETWAGNDTIAEKLTDVGFEKVVVTGEGAKRIGEGRWGKADTTAEVDPHLSDIVLIA